jgi:hypothetical protein
MEEYHNASVPSAAWPLDLHDPDLHGLIPNGLHESQHGKTRFCVFGYFVATKAVIKFKKKQKKKPKKHFCGLLHLLHVLLFTSAPLPY